MVVQLNSLLSTLRQQQPYLNDKYHVESLGIFGSVVRGEEHQESDLDLLVTFSETPSLLEFISLEIYLSELLGVKVDLVMKDSLKPHIGKHILAEVVPV
ncbi:MAG: nucleotidyltransferase family protein [Anaerolineales bacterium]|nr:nucleotidyltransferase family protein [Anaerolineales bacterium]